MKEFLEKVLYSKLSFFSSSNALLFFLLKCIFYDSERQLALICIMLCYFNYHSELMIKWTLLLSLLFLMCRANVTISEMFCLLPMFYSCSQQKLVFLLAAVSEHGRAPQNYREPQNTHTEATDQGLLSWIPCPFHGDPSRVSSQYSHCSPWQIYSGGKQVFMKGPRVKNI